MYHMALNETQPTTAANPAALQSLAPSLHADIPITPSITRTIPDPILLDWANWDNKFRTAAIAFHSLPQLLVAKGSMLYCNIGQVSVSTQSTPNIDCDILLAIIGLNDTPPTSEVAARRLEGTQIFSLRSSNTMVLRQELQLSFPLGVSRDSHSALPPSDLPAIRISLCPVLKSPAVLESTSVLTFNTEVTVSGWGRLTPSTASAATIIAPKAVASSSRG
jgi:hypothetical protein